MKFDKTLKFSVRTPLLEIIFGFFSSLYLKKQTDLISYTYPIKSLCSSLYRYLSKNTYVRYMCLLEWSQPKKEADFEFSTLFGILLNPDNLISMKSCWSCWSGRWIKNAKRAAEINGITHQLYAMIHFPTHPEICNKISPENNKKDFLM